MRVTEKGQVTIPLPVRRRLGIKPGSEVEFELRDGEAVLRPIHEYPDEAVKQADRLIEHLRRQQGTIDLGGLSVDEFMSLLRD